MKVKWRISTKLGDARRFVVCDLAVCRIEGVVVVDKIELGSFSAGLEIRGETAILLVETRGLRLSPGAVRSVREATDLFVVFAWLVLEIMEEDVEKYSNWVGVMIWGMGPGRSGFVKDSSWIWASTLSVFIMKKQKGLMWFTVTKILKRGCEISLVSSWISAAPTSYLVIFTPIIKKSHLTNNKSLNGHFVGSIVSNWWLKQVPLKWDYARSWNIYRKTIWRTWLQLQFA